MDMVKIDDVFVSSTQRTPFGRCYVLSCPNRARHRITVTFFTRQKVVEFSPSSRKKDPRREVTHRIVGFACDAHRGKIQDEVKKRAGETEQKLTRTSA